MKITADKTAFTFTELLVVLAVIAILAAVVPIQSMQGAKRKAQRIQCVSNLKQIGCAYRIWGSEMPFPPAGASTQNGGWKELLASPDQGINCWTNYAIMASELQTPRILVCPSDERTPATGFLSTNSSQAAGNTFFKSNIYVSYFVGVTARDTLPESILGGDRNLSPGLTPRRDCGFSPSDGRGNDVTLQTNSDATPVCWSLLMHSKGNAAGAGNILLGDGSVQQCSSSRFRTDYQPFAADNLRQLPPSEENWPTGKVPKEPSFRLIFP